jgi:hypothetical protein
VNDLTLPEELLLLSFQNEPQAHRDESCRRALAAAHVGELEDERLRRQLLEFSAGRQGRIEAVQVDLASRRLLGELSATPGESGAR